MKKTYITPELEDLNMNYQFSLLAGSLLSDDEAVINNENIGIDEDGSLDPDSREFHFFEED